MYDLKFKKLFYIKTLKKNLNTIYMYEYYMYILYIYIYIFFFSSNLKKFILFVYFKCISLLFQHVFSQINFCDFLSKWKTPDVHDVTLAKSENYYC